MRIELSAVKHRRYLAILLSGSAISILLTIYISVKLGSGLPTEMHAILLFLSLFFFLNFVTVVLANRLSFKKTVIELNSGKVAIDTRIIPCDEIKGYFSYDGGLLGKISLLLKTGEIVHLYTFSFGRKKRNYTKVKDAVVDFIISSNSSAVEVDCNDAHPKETKFVKSVYPYLITIIGILFVVTFYPLITGRLDVTKAVLGLVFLIVLLLRTLQEYRGVKN